MIKTAQKFNFSKKPQGFTLVELLVVIAIVAILAAIVVLIINPLELTRRSRDAARLTDLASLQQAINVAVQESTDSAQDILCKTVGSASCTGKSGGTGGGTRAIDGSGWVHVGLGNQNAVSVPTLPVDPQNTTLNHYTYCADTSGSAAKWVIFTKLESIQQKDKMKNDGGNSASQTPNNEDVYEVGSDLSLTKGSGCAY